MKVLNEVGGDLLLFAELFFVSKNAKSSKSKLMTRFADMFHGF